MQVADCEDVFQILLGNLFKSLPGFVYDPTKGRFRDYLYRSLRNAIQHYLARPKAGAAALDTSWMAQVPADEDPEIDAVWEEEWVNHHYRQAMETIRRTFEPRSIEIFDRSVAGEDAASLARAFGMSTQAVHKVRQRIRARMEELIAVQIREEDRVDEPAAPSDGGRA
jgi:RNA polymerase sigma-70 factor (ECF subfamily)